jgi:hypothetical protein
MAYISPPSSIAVPSPHPIVNFDVYAENKYICVEIYEKEVKGN